MLRFIDLRWLTAFVLIVSFNLTLDGQEPADAPPSRRPGVSIGGPFGVIIGGGRGVRIGGPNGAQFGGGFGARFGGDSGAQFGGGEGVRIGPRDYDRSRRSAPADDDAAAERDPPGRFIDPQYDRPLPHEAVLHYPAEAAEKVRLRINGRDIELFPGDTIAVPGSDGGMSLQIARPIGGYGWRKSVRPGTYIFQQSGRGWTVVAGTIPGEQQQPSATPDDEDAPYRLNTDDSEAEQLPAPDPVDPSARDASDRDQPRRLLFRRRR